MANSNNQKISGNNIWDTLAKSSFNTQTTGKIDPRIADNMLIAWPPMLRLIKSRFKMSTDINALDFGCGTGIFCNQLSELGFQVTGIDNSRTMIKIAQKNYGTKIRFIEGEYSMIKSLGKFGLITTIMTVPFIEDLPSLFSSFAQALQHKGILIIADFNKEWVKACLKVGISFAGFDSHVNPRKGLKLFGKLQTKVNIREAGEYEELGKIHGLTMCLLSYPRFTKKFIKKYPDDRPKTVPEYLIMGFQKK